MGRNQEPSTLRCHLGRVARRLLAVGAGAGVFWGLIAAIGLLVLGVWLDLLWELAPSARIGAWSVAGLGAAVLLGVLVVRAIRSARDPAVARRLDVATQSGGRVLTGLDLDSPGAGVQDEATAELTVGLARMAVDRAVEIADRTPASEVVSTRPVVRSLGSLALIAAVLGLVILCLPRLAQTQWARFTSPYDDIPPFSWTQFDVTPGDTEVLFGDSLDVEVVVSGSPVENVELVLETEAGGSEALPMFPEGDGRWRTSLAKVTEPGRYYVRDHGTRSRRYNLGVITVPKIEQVTFRVIPPAYTREATYEGPLPDDGLAGLPGTVVEIRAKSNRPLSGGLLSLSLSQEDRQDEQLELTMSAVAQDASEAVGQFEITADGRFELRVIDTDGQASLDSFAGAITLLRDERPFVRLRKPQRTSLATPSATLPVIVSVEDDYGVSKVQLFRSLNDSRPLPMDLTLPESSPERFEQPIYLPLADYALQPGDTIKVFGRVEDNDPHGAKGSESEVALVRVISQEDFERMLRKRQGMEVLMSKYRAARRRMESLADEIDQLRRELEETTSGDSPEQSPDDPVAEEMREQLRQTVQRSQDEAEAIRRSAEHKLPYDIDENLSNELTEMSQAAQELGEQLDQLQNSQELSNSQLSEKLKELAEKMAGDRKEFDQQAMEPLDLLASIMPLLADARKFEVLVLRQIDLAQRLASLDGHDGEDDPALKVRMSELEEEQQAIRDELGALLEDILDHVEAVPEQPEFDKLRDTARQFVADVERSGAVEAMGDAVAGLAEFSGTQGYQKAQEAADLLAALMKQCEGQGMGQCASQCLAFQPSLSNCLGKTAQQMLQEMGLGSGSGQGSSSGIGGQGMGSGGQGGSSARRGGGRDMGLYGEMPGVPQGGGGGGGEQDTPWTDRFAQGGSPHANPDRDTWSDPNARQSAAGMSEGSIPIRYRRRVGRYFQRLSDELPDW